MTQVLGIVKEGKLIPEELWVKFADISLVMFSQSLSDMLVN
jgi:hypothetical protein